MDATSAFLRSAARAGSAPGQRLREMFGEIDGTDLITPKSYFFLRILLIFGKSTLVSYFDSLRCIGFRTFQGEATCN